MGWIGRLLQHRRGIAAGLLAIAALGAGGVTFRDTWRETPQDRGVIAEWNDAIFRLGIDPVFPPEEDVYVGDLLAVITEDRRPNKERNQDQPFLNRAIKIAHLDMRPELEASYRLLPTFPETGPRPKSSDDPWLMSPSSDLFAPADKRPYLAIAAFPGFSIQHEQAAQGGFAGLGAALFGIGREESDLVEVKIPFAETYGVPSLVAAGKLAQFCEDPFTAEICTDRILRQHLSFVAGQLDSLGTDPVTGKPFYLVDVELALVNRVYLTRSIDQVRTLGRSQAARLQAKALSLTAGETPGAEGPQPADAAAEGEDTPASRLNELNRKVDALVERLDGEVPGAAAGVSADANSRYGLKQTFQRPVVIGYRAVRTSFPVTFDAAAPAADGSATDDLPVPVAEQ